MALPITNKLPHLHIPLDDIRQATNNFHVDNIISTGGFGPAYKGRLLWAGEWIKIAARRLDRSYGPGSDLLFWTEVSVLADLKHPNIVSLIGYCDEEGEKIIITSYETRGSLSQFLNSPTLTWTQRLQICLGVARALSYLHLDHGRNYAVIHRNINSYTILLDENWEPKLSGFEISIKQPVNRMDHVVLCEPIGEEGYMDPEFEKTKGATYKTDTYSFGVVLFEILCGRVAFIENDANTLLVPLARYHYEKKTLQDIIHPDLWSQMSPWSLVKYSKCAFRCTEDQRAYRPDMDYIIGELNVALEFQLARQSYVTIYEHLKIPLADIQSATENFSEICNIGLTRSYALYRAELYLSDKEFPSSMDGNNRNEVPKRHTNAVIKRVLPSDDELGEVVFYTELKMLKTVDHSNIVTLLGFCIEGPEMIIVIENLFNGCLEDILLDDTKKRVLTWEKRLKTCIDVAQALNYIHSEMEDQQIIINHNIKSYNIALDENWKAKITDFGMSKFLPPNQVDEGLYQHISFGTPTCKDPEYHETGMLKRESDVYSFGVLLFEILCGRLACDPIYLEESIEGLAPVARRCFNLGTLEDMIDPIIKDEKSEDKFVLNRGPDKDSMRTFVEIAYKCVAERQDQRPTMKVILNQLEKALSLQEERIQCRDMGEALADFFKTWEPDFIEEISEERIIHSRDTGEVLAGFFKTREPEFTEEISGENMENLKIPLTDIQLATENFSEKYNACHYFYYELYKVELQRLVKVFSSYVDGKNKDKVPQRYDTAIIKRFFPRGNKDVEEEFYTEIKMHSSVKHPNIANLYGFCVEGPEMIIVTECTDNSLGVALQSVNMKRLLSWETRLKICIDVARALNYIHFEMENQKIIINRCICSKNIALDENWEAKINSFAISVFLPPNQDDEALYFDVANCRGDNKDPEYKKTGKLKRESDVYGFGVVLFEVLFGRLASDPIYFEGDDEGLAFVARRCFNMGTLVDMIDPLIKDKIGENSFILSRGPNKDSVRTFIEIAYQCLAETHDQRPNMKVVLKQLEEALCFQENNKDSLFISLEDIKLATNNFHVDNCIGGGGFGKVYIGKLQDGVGYKTIVAKRLDTRLGQGEQQFLGEIQILLEYRHANVIGLVGYCDEKGEKIIIYEYASRRSLDRYLGDDRLTWMKRLNICIEVASALDFLHGGAGKQAKVVHRDIKTANILLTHEWKAKLADFGLSLISPLAQESDYIIDRPCGTRGYVDPLYEKSKFLTIKSDIYSFGVVLFEILCGRSTFTIYEHEGLYLPEFVNKIFEEGKHDELVFKQIREQVMPESLTAFQEIAYQCLQHESEKRPTTTQVLIQLRKALEFQNNTKMHQQQREEID